MDINYVDSIKCAIFVIALMMWGGFIVFCFLRCRVLRWKNRYQQAVHHCATATEQYLHALSENRRLDGIVKHFITREHVSETREEELTRLNELLQVRRNYSASGLQKCSVCKRMKHFVVFDTVDLSSECEDCFLKRRRRESLEEIFRNVKEGNCEEK